MRKFFILCLLVLTLCTAHKLKASTITDISDALQTWFGVHPTLKSLGNGGTEFELASLKPTSETQYIIQDWTSSGAAEPSPPGYDISEFFDVEAIYFKSDTSYFYIGIITSFPRLGINDPWDAGRGWVIPGDIAIGPWGGASGSGDKDNNGRYDYDEQPPAPYTANLIRYDYGIKINNISGQTSYPYKSDGVTPISDVKIYETTTSDWYQPNEGTGINAKKLKTNILSTPTGSNFSVDFGYGLYLSEGDDPNPNGTPPLYDPSTYVLLAKFDQSIIDLSSGYDHGIGIQWAPSCANDYLSLQAEYITPEPSTILLTGLGLIGFLIYGGITVKQKRNHS